MSFLSETAQQIWDQYKTEIETHYFLFPTRRSMLYFNRNMAAHVGRPIWMPNGLTSDGWVKQHCPYIIADELTLVYYLYKIAYEIGFVHNDFQEFYPFGKVILSDFNDIDLSLADVNALFMDIEADHNSYPEYGQNKDLWDSILTDKSSALQKQLVLNWKYLLPLYQQFKQSLHENGLAYKGMIYRYTVENLHQIDFKGQEVFHFIGFNHLTKAEEKLLKYLKDNHRCFFYWNTHPVLFQSSIEAAECINNGIQQFGQSYHRLKPVAQSQIEIIQTNTAIGQVKLAGQLVSEWQNTSLPENSAIILSDPILMEPLLSSLPEQVDTVNISMGYPLYYSPVKALLDWIFDIWASMEDDNYLHRDLVDRLMNHYYMTVYSKSKGIASLIDKQKYYLYNELSKDDPLLTIIFSKTKDIEEVFDKMLKILELLVEVSEVDFHIHVMSFAQHCITRLRDIVLKLDNKWSISFLQKLLAQFFIQADVPFKGEPLKGLQILGKLEMQNLSFDNVVIIGLNEGVWPNASNHSTIPVSVRQHYGLTSTRDKLQTSSYYFWTSVLNAQRVVLLHSSGDDVLGAKGESRYIQQLRFGELGLDVYEKTVGFETGDRPTSIKSIAKSKDIYKLLYIFLIEKGLSASSLNDYVECGFRFAYKHLLDVREKDIQEESISPKDFGIIFHNILQQLYSPYHSQNLTAEDFKSMKSQIPSLVESHYMEYFNIRDSAILGHGLHWLEIQTLINSLIRVIEIDSDLDPFSIISVEEKIEARLEVDDIQVKLKGFIDRVDTMGKNTYRIIDYKTGNSNTSGQRDTDFFGDNYKPHVVQLMMYVLLWNKNYPMKQPILSAHYTLKDKNVINYLKIMGETRINLDIINEFEDQLRDVVAQMLNDQLSFDQTDDIKKCTYCSFKTLCERQNIA
ncbi:PD-(D/E)XK nuclease family protein [Membranihabitans marinus]|uniref:PD-(D/E)XK nuclease family protein n=1 Tax=Membranihabitans marinus TaxID=1227546 RepID=UPI001F26F6A1|nr:PD-(D/E)XK nuclease family protein [Membranihabitans marinus]